MDESSGCFTSLPVLGINVFFILVILSQFQWLPNLSLISPHPRTPCRPRKYGLSAFPLEDGLEHNPLTLTELEGTVQVK